MNQDDAKSRNRLKRQVEDLADNLPVRQSAVRWLLGRRAVWLRGPLGAMFVLGGLFSILPVLGVWMLPLGLLLLAFDVPFIRPYILKAVILGRRWISVKWRSWRARN